MDAHDSATVQYLVCGVPGSLSSGLEDHDQDTARAPVHYHLSNVLSTYMGRWLIAYSDLSKSICTNLPIPPTMNSQFSEISQLSRSICHYVPLVKVLKDLINVTGSGTQMKYMRNGTVNGK